RRLLARLLDPGERLALAAAPRLGRRRWKAGRADRAARDRHLEARRRLASLLPLDRLLPGPALRRLHLVRARGRFRLRRAGAAGASAPARPGLSPGRRRKGGPALAEALLAAGRRPHPPAPERRARSRSRLPLQRSAPRRDWTGLSRESLRELS